MSEATQQAVQKAGLAVLTHRKEDPRNVSYYLREFERVVREDDMGLSLRLTSMNHARLIQFKRPGETWDQTFARLIPILEVVKDHSEGHAQAVFLDGLVDIPNETGYNEATIREAIENDS